MSERAPAADPALDYLASKPAHALIYLAQAKGQEARTAADISESLSMPRRGNWYIFEALLGAQLLEKANLPTGQTNGLIANPLDREYRVAAVSTMLDWSLVYPDRSLTDILGHGPGNVDKPHPRKVLEVLAHLSARPAGYSPIQLAKLIGQSHRAIDRVVRTLTDDGVTELITKSDLSHRQLRIATPDGSEQFSKREELTTAIYELGLEFLTARQEWVNGQSFVDALMERNPKLDRAAVRRALSNNAAKNISFADRDTFDGQRVIYKIRSEHQEPMADLAIRFTRLRDRDPSFILAAVARGGQILDTPEDISLLLGLNNQPPASTTTARRRMGSLTLQRLAVEKNWLTKAACSNNLEDGDGPFFPVGSDESSLPQIEIAKKICRTCPVAASCLQWSLDSGQVDGIFGGMTFTERREYSAKPGVPQPLPKVMPKTNAEISDELERIIESSRSHY